MFRTSALSVVFALVAVARADDPVFSGPQIGEKLSACKVAGVFGPGAGKEFDLTAENKGGPIAVIFIHELTRPATQLLRPVDAYGLKNADALATHFVWLSADRSKTENWLNWAKNSVGIKSPMSLSLDGIEGPGNFGLNRKVQITVLLAKDNKVVANFAIIQPNETDAPKVLAEMGKLIGRPAPTAEDILAAAGAMRAGTRQDAARPADAAKVAELEKKIADLTKALDDARAELAKLKGGRPAADAKRPAADAKRPDAGRPNAGPPPELGNLMRRMINLSNDEATVKGVAEEMTKWAGDDRQKKMQLTEYCKRIVDVGYGNDFAKAALKRLAGL